MKSTISRLVEIGTEMNANWDQDMAWRNNTLASEAFELFCQLPDVLDGEYDAPAGKADLILGMLSMVDELTAPRLCIRIREQVERFAPDADGNQAMLAKLRDYVNPRVSTSQFRHRYGAHLRFDDVERSARMEEVYTDVEAEVFEALGDTPRVMGFCFAYWDEKKKALAKRGIKWRSPMEMNPGVLFD